MFCFPLLKTFARKFCRKTGEARAKLARNYTLKMTAIDAHFQLKRKVERRQLKYKNSIWLRKVLQERKEKGQSHLLVKDL